METHQAQPPNLSDQPQRLIRAAQALLALMAGATIVGFLGTQVSSGWLEATGMVRGWDFQQFYLAGMMPPEQLYDIRAFQELQRSILPVDERNIPFLPLYPPMLALYVQPLAGLSYLTALAIWWSISLLCYTIAGGMLWHWVDRSWRTTALLVMVGFFPLFVALRLGQLSPILLLITVMGLKYRSGLILSLLAIKPQYGLGVFLFLLLRRQWRLAAGTGMGVLIQLAVVGCVMGPEVILNYIEFAKVYAQHGELYIFPTGWVHAIAGHYGKATHLIVVGGVAVLCALSPPMEQRKETAGAVAFMLLFTPHLLLYDLVLLLVPMICLLPKWRILAVALIATSGLGIWICGQCGVSFTPLILITILVGDRLGAGIHQIVWPQKPLTAIATGVGNAMVLGEHQKSG